MSEQHEWRGEAGAWHSSGSLDALREFVQVSARVNPAVAKRAGLSHSELEVLELLSRDDQGPAALSRDLGVTTAATSGIIDRLVARGHAQRRPHPKDRRRTVVSISESGRAEAVSQLMPMFLGLAELDRSMTDGERAIVERYLRGATEALRRLL